MKANSVSNATTGLPDKGRTARRAIVASIAIAVLLLATAGVFLLADRGFPLPSRLTVTVNHIEFRNFTEKIVLEPERESFIHDTAFSIRMVDFVPDFTMDKKSGEVRSRSGELRNPAAKLQLLFDGNLVYETWVFKETPNIHRVLKPGFIFAVSDIRTEEQQ